MKRSQSSLEFLTIFGIGFVIIVVLGGIFLTYSNGAKKSLDLKQMNKIGDDLTSNIEQVYYLGSGNKLTMKASFPEGIENFTIVHKNVSNPSGIGYIQYDFLNISYYPENSRTINTYSSMIFETNEIYMRFNCTKCYHTTNLNGNWSSYFNSSDFTAGTKQIKVESKGDWVDIGFVTG